jgi:OmpA family protein
MSSDSAKVSDIASYLRQNPRQQIGIDGSMDPKNTDLSKRRVSAVGNALLQAGVPSYKIQTWRLWQSGLSAWTGASRYWPATDSQRLKQVVTGPATAVSLRALSRPP